MMKRGFVSGAWEVGSGKWEVGSGKWEVGCGEWGVGRYVLNYRTF